MVKGKGKGKKKEKEIEKKKDRREENVMYLNKKGIWEAKKALFLN